MYELDKARELPDAVDDTHLTIDQAITLAHADTAIAQAELLWRIASALEVNRADAARPPWSEESSRC